jgi:undecaprenyl-diphosphatase
VDLALLAKALVLGVIEGLTEFLPISSTGHLVLAGELLRFTGEKTDVFKIVIQSGAMLAIILEYRTRFLNVLKGLGSNRAAQRFVLNLLVAFLPAAVLGLAFGRLIKTYLFHAEPIALAFIVGALIILWVERPAVGPKRRAFALIPGTSRSGATIIGGMLFGLSRKAATEFSFFLAVPTLVAAGAYDFWKNRALFDSGDVGMFAVGSVAAFVSAFLCVRWLLRYIATHDFTPFAWYRIVFGAAVLATAYAGVVNWSAG